MFNSAEEAVSTVIDRDWAEIRAELLKRYEEFFKELEDE